MVVCPLCEHPQSQGDTCEVCGRALGELGAVPVATPMLEGLERTALDGGEGATFLLPIPDLTSHRSADVSADVPPIPGLEATSLSEPVAQPTAPSPAAGPPACRYCGHRQSEGALCERCGMQLPRLYRGSDLDEEGRSPCPVCGVKGRLRDRCPSCGAHLQALRSNP